MLKQEEEERQREEMCRVKEQDLSFEEMRVIEWESALASKREDIAKRKKKKSSRRQSLEGLVKDQEKGEEDEGEIESVAVIDVGMATVKVC